MGSEFDSECGETGRTVGLVFLRYIDNLYASGLESSGLQRRVERSSSDDAGRVEHGQ